jgi:hypothetical protein
MKQEHSHEISLAEAIDLTTRYRNHPVANLPLCETYSKASVELMLSYPGTASFRIYYGKKSDNSICSVLVAVNEEGADILPDPLLETTVEDEEPIILENAFHCPPICPPESPLNG